MIIVVGIIAFSFAKRSEPEEPNPCNKQLAYEVECLKDSNPDSIIIAQWEIAKQLESDGYKPDLVVNPSDSTTNYLTSQDVWNNAKQLLKSRDVSSVFIVAQPFLHLYVIKTMIQKDDYLIKDRKILHHIGFDNSNGNRQWWTKGPIRFLVYAIIVKLTGKNGIGERR